jgi:hypothetical protein
MARPQLVHIGPRRISTIAQGFVVALLADDLAFTRQGQVVESFHLMSPRNKPPPIVPVHCTIVN